MWFQKIRSQIIEWISVWKMSVLYNCTKWSCIALLRVCLHFYFDSCKMSQIVTFCNYLLDLNSKFHVNRHYGCKALYLVLSDITWWNNFIPCKILIEISKRISMSFWPERSPRSWWDLGKMFPVLVRSWWDVGNLGKMSVSFKISARSYQDLERLKHHCEVSAISARCTKSCCDLAKIWETH